jgi:outer membrane protein assembly factor BamB
MKRITIALVVVTASSFTNGAGFEFVSSSFLGGSNFDDTVVGARFLSDGTIVLAANLAPDTCEKIGQGGAGKPAAGNGAAILLDADGKKITSFKWIGADVRDMAVDAKDNIYLAASGGIVKMDAKTGKVVWTKAVGDCARVDASPGGLCAAIAGGRIHIFDPTGRALGEAKGSHYTCDVCIDEKTKTVVFCGFRNAKAFDGKKTYPVQICYIHGLDYSGKRKWTNYDWSTDRNSDRFLNKPTNNMADSRGDRCTIGRDGKLYVTFQVAGGNHLFRYSPRDIMKKVKLAGGDKYHQFYNSKSEHKCFFARYNPATGDFLAGQQLCGRLSSGRANAVVTKTGEINADEQGRVYVVGSSAYGLPLNMNPDNGDYTGGGFILVMSPDLKTRLLCTRTAAGKGSSHAVDVRSSGNKVRVVYGGSKMVQGMFTRDPVQAKAADAGTGKKDPRDGFFAVIEAK